MAYQEYAAENEFDSKTKLAVAVTKKNLIITDFKNSILLPTWGVFKSLKTVIIYCVKVS